MAKAVKKKKTIRSIPQQRTPVRELDPQVRVKNFEEVNCGYSLNEALNEAERCLLCPEPGCIAGCRQYPHSEIHRGDRSQGLARRL